MLDKTLYPLFRHVDFRGKGRLRRRLPVPEEGRPVVSFPGGLRLRLDLRESLQRDFLFGLYDRHELELMRERLRGGGDMVDVGAHIGMYAVAAARALGSRGRVLAFEPNPQARAQLEENLRLNGVEVIVRTQAVAEERGETLLHVPATPDPSFSSLEGGRFVEGEAVPVETTTVDDEVDALGLRPAFVKIDVEGGELRVLAGMRRTLELRPTLLVEVSDVTAHKVEGLLPEHRAFRVLRRSLEPGLAGGRGLFNALFLPG